ncbi:MAG: hypothetical protein K8I27_16550 [Planctomycetes bacterium]|nr:hypothetical protein [Planctomycetota bacterium]
MKLDGAQLLMNRYLDGVATAEEREQLARAMRCDPLLRGEFEEIESVHASTQSLFQQLALPEDFSKRVMRRVQDAHVPSDGSLDAVRLPAQRPLRTRRRFTSTHRRRARVYAIVATISAAAALLLAVGVFSGFFASAGIGTRGEATEQDLAEGRQGGPDREELNRTDSSSLPPSRTDKREAPPQGGTPGRTAPVEPAGRSQPEVPDIAPAPQPEVIEHPQPAELEPLSPAQGKDVVKTPEPANPEPVKPADGDTVEQPGTPATEPLEDKTGKTEALPADRVRIGRMLVLNGKADLVNNAGESRPMGEEQELFQGDRVRTSVNGLILVRTDAGDLTVQRGSEVTLESDQLFSLLSGTVALSRGNHQAGTDIAVKGDDFTLYLNHGCAVVERKRRGLAIQKPFGFASVSHEEFGTILLDDASGYELDLEFGKPAAEARKKVLALPGWSAESRSKSAMLAIMPLLKAREYPAREFRYIEDRLPKRLDRVLSQPVSADAVIGFLTESIANNKFDAGTLIMMVNELEAAYLEVTELSPEVITTHAKRAALIGEDFTQWRDYFYRLMRPPVEPKSSGDTDCPNADKVKRGEALPLKKKIVKVPQTPEADDPAAESDPSG